MNSNANNKPKGIVNQSRELLNIILKWEAFSNLSLETNLHISSTPKAHIGMTKKNSGVKVSDSPNAPSAKNQEINNATKPVNITLPITKTFLSFNKIPPITRITKHHFTFLRNLKSTL